MRSLILYYTYHGNTQRIAERIHAAIGGDIARIDTVAPYTGDYDDVVAQGEREVKQGYLPPLKPMDIDLDRYDTIVLGTPVWWYTCSPAMRAFLTAHDLSGKTVYPFATNGGWLGRSIRDMRALCPGAAFRPGLDVHFDDTTQRTPDADVDRWIAAKKPHLFVRNRCGFCPIRARRRCACRAVSPSAAAARRRPP